MLWLSFFPPELIKSGNGTVITARRAHRRLPAQAQRKHQRSVPRAVPGLPKVI
jgi:hypothetical protein